MNVNQFNRKARRAAQKQGKKLGRKLSLDEAKQIKIQTVPLWLQTIVSLFGLLIIFVGFYVHPQHENFWISLIIVLAGLVFFFLGLFGKKKTLENIADGIADQTVGELIGGIFDIF